MVGIAQVITLAWTPPALMSGLAGDPIFKLTLTGSANPAEITPRDPQQEKALALFDELRGPLQRYVLSLGVVPDHTEEMIQESFLKLFEHLKAGKPETNLRGWLFRVAHNLAIRDLRRFRSQVVSGEALFDLIAASLEDTAPDPERRLILNQREARLLDALKELSEVEQRCLHLRAEGLLYREIAGVLNLGVTTVADSLRRAIAALQRKLRE